MARAMVIFEDGENDVTITMENTISDNPTPAQESAMLLFMRLQLAVAEISKPGGVKQTAQPGGKE